MIEILGTIFSVKVSICFKSCYISQRNPYFRIVLEDFSIMRVLTLDYWESFLEYPI